MNAVFIFLKFGHIVNINTKDGKLQLNISHFVMRSCISRCFPIFDKV